MVTVSQFVTLVQLMVKLANWLLDGPRLLTPGQGTLDIVWDISKGILRDYSTGPGPATSDRRSKLQSKLSPCGRFGSSCRYTRVQNVTLLFYK
jgi:hypothetical protein